MSASMPAQHAPEGDIVVYVSSRLPATGLHCLKSCIDTIAEYLADPHLTHRISSRGGFDEREAAPRHGRGGHCRLL
jgi:hypothetical protein